MESELGSLVQTKTGMATLTINKYLGYLNIDRVHQ